MPKNHFMKIRPILYFFLAISILSCDKEDEKLRYFEVGFDGTAADWRDSSFVVATANPVLIKKLHTQLQQPVDSRKIVSGRLLKGDGGYNSNAGHRFGWHFSEDQWDLVDMSAEIYDGRPYSDLDLNPSYWLDTMQRFAPWGSYIKKEIALE